MGRDHEDRTDDEQDELDIEEEESHGTRNLIFGLLAGAAVGAVVALLFAPDSGDRTRRRLAEGARHLRDEAGEQVTEWTDSARHQFRRRQRQAKKKFNRATREARRALESITS